MKYKSLKNISNLNVSKKLNSMINTAKNINTINTWLKTKLPSILAAELDLAIIHDGEAVFVSTSAAIAYKANLSKNQILKILNEYEMPFNVNKIKIKVANKI